MGNNYFLIKTKLMKFSTLTLLVAGAAAQENADGSSDSARPDW